MKYILIVFPIFFLSCQQHSDLTAPPSIEVISKAVELKNFTYEDIAKYTMSVIMGQPSKIITSEKKDDLYIVSYFRKSDKQKFTYKVKFDNNKIVWANIDGRWRDGAYDEKLEFEELGNALLIHTIYSDGSKETIEFKK